MAKKTYKVCGYAEAKGGTDIEVNVKAASPDAALTEAVKKEPGLEKHKDVRIYVQGGWTRCK